jgi:hypothetical protein
MTGFAATPIKVATSIPLPSEAVLANLPPVRGAAIPPATEQVMSVASMAAIIRSTPPANVSLPDALMQGKPVIASRTEVLSRLNPFQDGSKVVWVTDGKRNPDGTSRAVPVGNLALGGPICASNNTGAIFLPVPSCPDSLLVVPLAKLGSLLPGSPHIHEPGEIRDGSLQLSPAKTAVIQALLSAGAFPTTFSRQE